ncbi:MAG: DUF4157 domain-containing protein [Myxococcota bacterium]
MQSRGGATGGADEVHAAAARGVGGGGGALPHLGAIQRAFGRHDVSDVRAHTGASASAACGDMGADAYASGKAVAFRGPPSLHTAAHEAAHVIQQKRGVSLEGGIGAIGDRYERHADQVADAVVQGKSAEALLDPYAAGGAGAGAVQRKAVQRADAERTTLLPDAPPQTDSPFDPEPVAAPLRSPDYTTPAPADIASDGDRPAVPPPESDARTQVICAINDRRNRAKDDLQVIIAERDPLDEKIAIAKAKTDPSDEDKKALAALEARKKTLETDYGRINTTIQKASAELDTAKNPATSSARLKQLGARYGTAEDSGPETEQESWNGKDDAAVGFKKGPSVDNGYVDVNLPGGGSGTKRRSDTVSEVKNGAASTVTNTKTSSLTSTTDTTESSIVKDDIAATSSTTKTSGYVDGGLGKKTSQSDTLVMGEDSETKESSKSTTLGAGGLTRATTSSETKTQNGQTTSTSSSNKMSLGSSGLDNTKTNSKTDAAGTKTTDTDKIHVGLDGASASSARSVTDKDGNEKSSSVNVGASKLDDENGKGVGSNAGAGTDRKRETTDARGGKSTTSYGAKAACDGKVQFLVQPIAKSDPPKVRVLVTVNLGASLGANASKEKSDGGGTKAGVNGSVSASGNVMGQFGQEMLESEVQGYRDHIEQAGYDAAAQMCKRMNAILGDPNEIANLPEGASVELDVSGEAGGKLGGSVGPVGLNAGASEAVEIKFGVQKKDGKLIVTAGVSDKTTTSVGGSVNSGAVGMSVGHSNAHGTGAVYVFTLDPAKDQGAFAELRACRTQAALKAFADSHPELRGEHSETTSDDQKDTQGFTLGGDALAVNFEQGAGRSSTKHYDKEGRLTGEEREGHNSQGGSVSAAGFTYSDTNTEQATAMKVDGEDAVDVHQTNETTNLGNQIVNRIDKKIGGSGKELDEDNTNVAGMVLSKGDLQALIAKAESDDAGAWGNHTGDGDIRDDWMKVRSRVRAAGGDTSKVANILADFVGTKKAGRDDVIYATVRGTGDAGGGHRYELPESLAASKDEFVALTVGNPLKPVTAFVEQWTACEDAGLRAELDKQVAAQTAACDEVIRRCQELYQTVYTASARTEEFEHGGDIQEMLAQVSRRQSEAELLKGRLAGKDADVLDQEKALRDYNANLTVCSTSKEQADKFFAQIADIVGEDDAVGTGDAADVTALVTQLKALYAQWEAAYGTILKLHGDYGVGTPTNFVRLQPDAARFSAAHAFKNPNKPEVLAKADEAREKALGRLGTGPAVMHAKKKEEKSYVQSYDPVKEQAAHDEKFEAQAQDIGAQVPVKRSKAESLRSELEKHLKTSPRADARTCYDQGVAKQVSAERYASRIDPKIVSTLAAEGQSASEDFGFAIAHFKEGLAFYPGASGGGASHVSDGDRTLIDAAKNNAAMAQGKCNGMHAGKRDAEITPEAKAAWSEGYRLNAQATNQYGAMQRGAPVTATEIVDLFNQAIAAFRRGDSAQG